MESDILEWAVNRGLELGANEIELYYTDGSTISLGLIMASMPNISKSQEEGVGIRVVVDKRIGFSYTTKLTKESLEEAIKDAISSAKASKPIEKWVSLPEPGNYPSVEGVFDESLVDLSESHLIEIVNELLAKISEAEKRAIPIQIEAGAGAGKKIVINSNGVNTEDKGTFNYLVLVAMGVEGNVRTPMLFDFSVSRTKGLNIEETVNSVAEQVRITLKSASGETEKSTVIFHPYALQGILEYTLINALNGDSLMNNRTPFRDKLNEEVASDSITIIDDGTLKGGFATSRSDDEGVPTQRKTLIDKGVLRGFYHNNYTGKALGEKSTGNGIRGSSTAMSSPPYATLPEPKTTNFIIEPGDASLQEMITEINKGYLLLGVQGAHSSNPESGEFSVAASPLWKIENGEIIGSVRGAMVSGNIYNLLKNVLFVSKEQKTIFNMYLPYIAFRDVNIITK